MNLKYVMFRLSKPTPRYFPVFFFEQQVHAEIADAVEKIAHGSEFPVAVSAGSVYFDKGMFNAHGKSESLGLKVHPDDAAIMDAMPYFHGVCGRKETPENVKAIKLRHKGFKE